MTGKLESLAYAISRGISRGYFDALFEAMGKLDDAIVEASTPESRARARRMRDAWNNRMRPAAGNPGPHDSQQDRTLSHG